MKEKTFAWHIDYAATDKDLFDAFNAITPVNEAMIIKENKNGEIRSKSFGFVTFKDYTGFSKVIDHRKLFQLHDRLLKFKEAEPKNSKS